MIRLPRGRGRRGGGRWGGGRGCAGPKRPRHTVKEEEVESRDRWESCRECGFWVNLGRHESTECIKCGTTITRQTHNNFESWAQCDACGKWRAVPNEVARELEEAGDDAKWTCSMLFDGATCRSNTYDWSYIMRTSQNAKAAAAAAAAIALTPAAHSGPIIVSSHTTQLPEGAAPSRAKWAMTGEVLSNGGFEEYVLGRDELLAHSVLAAGFDAFDDSSGEHLLATLALPAEAMEQLRPFVFAVLRLWVHERLPVMTDGRASAGPVDLAAYLAQPHAQQQVQQALQRREVRLRAEGKEAPRHPHQNLCYVVHVSPDGRKVYIGEEGDATCNGGSIMDFQKSWKSCPINSWSGGCKLADMPGATPNRVVRSRLTELLADEEAWLVAAAEVAWRTFAEHEHTRDAAERMLQAMMRSEAQRVSRLGTTAWNAYSLNIDFRTARHIDGKNVPGSYSALIVMEVGAEPHCGGLYLLPQYHKALDVRQGVVLLHRSGDAHVGLHANSAIHRPHPGTHRVSIVLYQTELEKDRPHDQASGTRSSTQRTQQQEDSPAVTANTSGENAVEGGSQKAPTAVPEPINTV